MVFGVKRGREVGSSTRDPGCLQCVHSMRQRARLRHHSLELWTQGECQQLKGYEFSSQIPHSNLYTIRIIGPKLSNVGLTSNHWTIAMPSQSSYKLQKSIL